MKKIIRFVRKNYLLIVFLCVLISFFGYQASKSLYPIPSDTIVGLYYPFRDLYSNTNPNGIPFKNFLITDPVRQIIPWKSLGLSSLSGFSLPLWNPYEMAGKPLLGNFQSSVFYPLNLILFIKPFYLSWSLFIYLQLILSSVFLYFYLKSLSIGKEGSILGVIAFCFSGFVTSWFEWGTVIHTALWLPLILFCIDKSFKKPKVIWSSILLLSLIFSFFGGHLQTFFYLLIFSLVYSLARFIQNGWNLKTILRFLVIGLVFIFVTMIQWLPSLQLINLSARVVDQEWIKLGWFIPWQNLIQFIAPDFFGNPTTLNYWGIWNYAEFVGYVGFIPIIFALYSMTSRFDKKTLFFGSAFFTSLIFAFPTFFAKIPFLLNLPFVSSSQPTRLLFITCFSLAVLAALGFDYFVKTSKKNIFISISFFGLAISGLWFFVLNFKFFPELLSVSKRNLVFPSLIFALFILLSLVWYFVKGRVKKVLIVFLIIAAFIDGFRFFTKFNTFSDSKYFFPDTKIVNFLKNDKDIFRIASFDSRVIAPNFSTYYKIQSVEGYDPLYIKSYAELIAASERGKPDINPPFGFNRIITPHNLSSDILDLLNVKYVLSLDEINNNKFEKVYEWEKTKVYKNKKYLPRTFFVDKVVGFKSKQEQINGLFSNDLKRTAIVEEELKSGFSLGTSEIINYSENEVTIHTKNKGEGFLVLTDAFYPAFKAVVDGKMVKVYKADYAFRGIIVPKGEHEVKFFITL